MIELDNLTKVFDTPKGAVTAADNISMKVPSGEICILLGPSGCGKTTSLKMINRIIRPTSGRVLINGASQCQSGGGSTLCTEGLSLSSRTDVELLG